MLLFIYLFIYAVAIKNKFNSLSILRILMQLKAVDNTPLNSLIQKSMSVDMKVLVCHLTRSFCWIQFDAIAVKIMEDDFANLTLLDVEEEAFQEKDPGEKCPFPAFYEIDVKRVMEGSPQFFNNHHLLLHSILTGEDPLTLPLDMVEFWVQIYDLPSIPKRNTKKKQ